MRSDALPSADLLRRRHAAERALRRLERLDHARDRPAVRDWVDAARAGVAPWTEVATLGERRLVDRLELSHHAVGRWQQRVDPDAALDAAEDALAAFVATAIRRPRPRHWMAGRAIEPGSTFLYAHDRPDVCAIAVDGVVVTVVSRAGRGGPRRARASAPAAAA